MQYSDNPVFPAGDSLAKAQIRKLDALIAMAKLKAQDNVLEIGFGWGSLAIRAAQVSFQDLDLRQTSSC